MGRITENLNVILLFSQSLFELLQTSRLKPSWVVSISFSEFEFCHQNFLKIMKGCLQTISFMEMIFCCLRTIRVASERSRVAFGPPELPSNHVRNKMSRLRLVQLIEKDSKYIFHNVLEAIR